MNELDAARGNTFFAEIEMTDENGNVCLLESGEKLIIGIKVNPEENGGYIVIKELTEADEINGKYPFMLTADEIDIDSKRYWFGASVLLNDGILQPVVKCKEFYITPAVIRKGGLNNGN
ncbi:MAG: hypothetical protein IJ192_11535 [Clostridia bacterium]|nr:hypothetical protein [Clostridia bacterium]